MIVSEKIGRKKAGENWAEYLEYGTMDHIVIELQNIGLPRHLSMIIKNEYPDCLTFEDETLVDISIERLLEEIDKNKYKDELEEMKKIFA